MAVLVDTGILYAAADRSDAWHARSATFLRREPEVLLVPAGVLPEVCYLLLDRLGEEAELGLVRAISGGELDLEHHAPADYRRAQEILEAYRGQRFGLVDALVMATAERLGIRRIATVDRQHFSIYRPMHCEAFELVP